MLACLRHGEPTFRKSRGTSVHVHAEWNSESHQHGFGKAWLTMQRDASLWFAQPRLAFCMACDTLRRVRLPSAERRNLHSKNWGTCLLIAFQLLECWAPDVSPLRCLSCRFIQALGPIELPSVAILGRAPACSPLLAQPGLAPACSFRKCSVRRLLFANLCGVGRVARRIPLP
jgi:hypothetical protein